jgi:hypothetical protein
MTNQDVDPVNEFAEIRDFEHRMHAENEARELEGEQDQLAEHGSLPVDPDEDEEMDEDD